MIDHQQAHKSLRAPHTHELEAGAEDFPNNLPFLLSSPIQRDKAIRALTRYSLVDREQGSLRIHRLVQTVIQDGLSPANLSVWLSTATNLIANMFLFRPDSPEYWPQVSETFHHAVTVVAANLKYEQNRHLNSDLLHRIRDWHIHNHEHQIATIALLGALEEREKCVKEDDISLAPILISLALALQEGPFYDPTHNILKKLFAHDLDVEEFTGMWTAWTEIIVMTYERAIEIEKKHAPVGGSLQLAKRTEPYSRFIRNMGGIGQNHRIVRFAEKMMRDAYEMVRRDVKIGNATNVDLAHFVNTLANCYRYQGKTPRHCLKRAL